MDAGPSGLSFSMVDRDAVGRLSRLQYIQPLEPLSRNDGAIGRAERDLGDLIAWQPDLVIIDGVTEAMSIEGLDLSANPDVAR